MLLASILLYISWNLCFLSPASATRGTMRASTANRYARTYSLGASNEFNARDGWETVNITSTFSRNMEPQYLARGEDNRSKPVFERRKKNRMSRSRSKKPLGTIGKQVKMIGEAITSVAITWYTGNDLLNPSCWSKQVWTPTDQSLVCAVTLEGWSTRPACFEFLELCTSENVCITVRVVDTCAGCKAGSKHVDLTREAFRKLAPLDVGITSVAMRPAAEPKEWSDDLYGPK